MYLIANLLEAGEFKQATELSLKLKDARGQLANTLYTGSPRDSISRLNPRLPVALRAADWTETLALLKSADPPATLPHLQFLARQLSKFAVGMQALDQHELSGAETASDEFDADLSRSPARSRTKPTPKPRRRKPRRLRTMRRQSLRSCRTLLRTHWSHCIHHVS